jgi:DNA mismatch endonuclease (patch repair protein)
VDHVPKEIRSRIMASVRSRGNLTTEQAMMKVLRRAGIGGYRRHLPVAGKPDFAWPRTKVALFVDGCFWHGCPQCNRPSKSNVAFWGKKIEDNKRRDRRVARTLRRSGWSVLRVWECRVGEGAAISRIRRTIELRAGLIDASQAPGRTKSRPLRQFAASGSS